MPLEMTAHTLGHVTIVECDGRLVLVTNPLTCGTS
jgi:hypothetical protein